MFNISFGELLAFAVIALIILGPEKLPQTLRVGLLKYRALKNNLNKIQLELENELE
ncbi:MAG: twin-arginine translocase subunit TatB, partial [Pseudomonadota bacterium]